MPVIAGLGRLRGLPAPWRGFVGFLALALTLNISMMTLGLRGIPNAAFAHLTLPIYCGAGLIVLGELARDHRWARGFRGAALLYVVAWLVITVVAGVTRDYSLVAKPLMHLLMTGGGAVLIVVRLGQLATRPLRDPAVMVGLGVLLVHAPTAVLDPVAAVVALSDRDLARTLYRATSVFSIVAMTPYTLALLWIPRRPSSSGS